MPVTSPSKPVSLNVKVDPALKREADALAHELGLSLTSAVTVYLKKFVAERRIPFEVSADPFYRPENMAHLRRVKADLDSGRVAPEAHALIED